MNDISTTGTNNPAGINNPASPNNPTSTNNPAGYSSHRWVSQLCNSPTQAAPGEA